MACDCASCKHQEKQTDEPTVQKAQVPRTKQSSEQEQGFGIDQTASFLSSGGVVLDDLLKLKQPSASQKGSYFFY